MKNLILVILLFVSVQSVSYAQKSRTFGDGAVEVELEAGALGRNNGCLITNTSDSWVEVRYDITFVKVSEEALTLEKRGMDITNAIQREAKSNTVKLAPAGTPRQGKNPSDKYWVTAGEGNPVNFDRTKISIIVKNAYP